MPVSVIEGISSGTDISPAFQTGQKPMSTIGSYDAMGETPKKRLPQLEFIPTFTDTLMTQVAETPQFKLQNSFFGAPA